MTLLIQVQNTSGSAFQPDPDWRHIYMTVGTHRLLRLISVSERPDNLIGDAPLAAGNSVQGSLTFLIHRPALAARLSPMERNSAFRLPRPPSVGLPQIGVIMFPRPEPGTVR